MAKLNELSRNGSVVSWPNIFMDFNGSQAVEATSARPTMASANFLGVDAHACDAAYLHTGFSSAGERLQVCSGYLGQPDAPDAYSSYLLSTDDDWTNVQVSAAYPKPT